MKESEDFAVIKPDGIEVSVGGKEYSFTHGEYNTMDKLIRAASESNIGAAYIDDKGLLHILNKKENNDG